MFGSHLSIAGSMCNALAEAQELTLDTVQVFTKNQRQWKVKPLDDSDADEWVRRLRALSWTDRAVSHNSYLINLASPNDELWEKSRNLQRDEIERCERLSIPFLVSHPGAHTGSGADAGITRIADAYTTLLKDTAGYNTVICLENTVGGGSTLGGPFEQLAAIRTLLLDAIPDEAEKRIAFCFDTAHALAFGHDVRTPTAVNETLASFEAQCGPRSIRVAHFNDSKVPFASHKDRHEHIGQGHVGAEGFRALVNHPALRHIPKILETPKEDHPSGRPWDAVNLDLLRSWLAVPQPAPKPGPSKRRLSPTRT